MGKKIKYLGNADRRVIHSGTDWGGRLADPTKKDMVWERSNNFIVDTDDVELSSEALSLLLEDDSFKDVSDLKVIPLSEKEKSLLGRTKIERDQVKALDEPDTKPDTNAAGSGSGSTTPAPRTTTAGGPSSGS